LILRASALLTEKLAQVGKLTLTIDLKPGLNEKKLDERLLRDFAEIPNKNFANALDALLPSRLIEALVTLSGIDPAQKVNSITKAQRNHLVQLFKSFPVNITGTAGYKEAVITKGGVRVSEINPATFMSKKVNGLFFAGEVLDVDAMTGGYNLQIAFSTGFSAGMSAAEYINEGVRS
jgi:hypothetical protein